MFWICLSFKFFFLAWHKFPVFADSCQEWFLYQIGLVMCWRMNLLIKFPVSVSDSAKRRSDCGRRVRGNPHKHGHHHHRLCGWHRLCRRHRHHHRLPVPPAGQHAEQGNVRVLFIKKKRWGWVGGGGGELRQNCSVTMRGFYKLFLIHSFWVRNMNNLSKLATRV